MKIFYSLMVLFAVAILFMLPISSAVYDFRTDIKHDAFYNATTAGTSANVTLRKTVYNADTTTVSIASDLYTDIPVLAAYNSTSRLMTINGLSTSSNRTLTVDYDYDVLQGWDSLNVILDRIEWIWLIMVICFAPMALVAMWVRKN